MGCAWSSGSRGPQPPRLLYCRLHIEHSHLKEFVDLRKLTKLIKSGRLAPLYPHELSAAQQPDGGEECPICTVTFPSMNTASCCAARVCTECFVYHQTSSDPPGQAQCPFCKTMPFAVRYLGVKPKEQLAKELEEEAAWRQAKQRLKVQQDMPVAPDATTSTAANNAAADGGDANSNSPSYSLQQQTGTVQQLQWHHQHSWLDELSEQTGSDNNNINNSSSSVSRRVEVIDVYAGYHARGSSSSGGGGAAGIGPDTGTLQDTSSESGAAAAALAAGPAAGPAAEQGGGLGLQAELEQQQQQEAAWRASQVLELQLQQLSELQQWHTAGLLPGYAAAELSGLDLEELDEILLEQAVLDSLKDDTAADAATGS